MSKLRVRVSSLARGVGNRRSTARWLVFTELAANGKREHTSSAAAVAVLIARPSRAPLPRTSFSTNDPHERDAPAQKYRILLWA